MGFSVLDYFFLNQNACWHWKDTYVLRYYRMFYLLYVGLEHVYDTLPEGKRNNEINSLVKCPPRVNLTTCNGITLKNDTNNSKIAAEQNLHRVEAGL